MDPLTLSLQSPAKINLSLRVGNRLSNGLHQIVTTIVPVGLCDQIQISLITGNQSICAITLGEELGVFLGDRSEALINSLSSLTDNIAARAATALLKEQAFELKIEKNIPVEAGLGGGSGDAATALLLANKCLASSLSQRELFQIAQSLGSDVGPMLFRQPVVQSKAEIKPTTISESVKDMELLLIKPPHGTSTRKAYEMLQRPEVEPGDPEFMPSFAIENDFEEAFFLQEWFQEGSHCLLQLNAQRVLLCGSGSALVGFFTPGSLNPDSIIEARKQLNNWWVYQTRFWS